MQKLLLKLFGYLPFGKCGLLLLPCRLRPTEIGKAQAQSVYHSGSPLETSLTDTLKQMNSDFFYAFTFLPTVSVSFCFSKPQIFEDAFTAGEFL